MTFTYLSVTHASTFSICRRIRPERFSDESSRKPSNIIKVSILSNQRRTVSLSFVMRAFHGILFYNKTYFPRFLFYNDGCLVLKRIKKYKLNFPFHVSAFSWPKKTQLSQGDKTYLPSIVRLRICKESLLVRERKRKDRQTSMPVFIVDGIGPFIASLPE